MSQHPAAPKLATVALESDEDSPATRRTWASVPGATVLIGGPANLVRALFPGDDFGDDEEPSVDEQREAESAFAEGRIPVDAVGYCDTYRRAGQTVVHDIYVLAEYQRRGVAAALLRAVRGSGLHPLRHRGLTNDGWLMWTAVVGPPEDGFVRG